MTAIKKMVDRVQSGSGPTPTPAPTATPAPAISPTPAPVCTTAANYYHVLAGRVYESFGYALANGSNQNMGLDNVFYQSTLEQIGPNDYVIGCP